MAEKEPPNHPDRDTQGKTNANDTANGSQQISAAIGDLSQELLRFKNQIQANNEAQYRKREQYERKQLFWSRIGTVASFFLGIVTIGVLAGAVYVALEQNRITGEQERAYVTLGRTDGVVAEFVFPDNPKDKAGIVVYFQNTGRLPAKFNWGTIMDIAVLPPTPDFPFVKARRFTPMTRTRNPEAKSLGETSGVVIAGGGSVHVAHLAEIPHDHAIQLSRHSRLFWIQGAYDYCDALGTYSCRLFDMWYQGIPYNSFRLGSDHECPVFMTVPAPKAGVEYFPPCPTRAEAETERKRQEKQFREAQKKAAAKKDPKKESDWY